MTILKRPTLAEQAYEELQNQIMLGALPAGERLLADEIAGRLAISPTPVKEALAQLERDGLIEGASRRASTVRRFDRQDLVEIFDARILLERTAVARGMDAGLATDEFVARLRANFAAHMAEVRRQEEEALPAAIALDCQFHEILLELSGNRTLRDWHRVVMRQTQAARNYTVKRYSMTRLEREHGDIIDAVAAGEATLAAEAIGRHLGQSLDELLSRAPEDFPVRA